MPAASVVPLRGQHSPSTLTQRPAAQQPQPQPPSTQALANFLELLNSIPSSPNYQVAEEILNEMTVLRNQLQSKEKELEQVKKAKEIAVNEMFDVNEAQKSKQKEIALEMDSLKKSIQLAKDALSQKEREIHAFDGQYRKVQADLTQVQSDLKTAQHDIDGLQKKVKEKDLLIDKVKASHSEGQKRSKAAEERVAAMEKEKSALAESLQAAKARLDKIEGYTTQHSNCDEDSMVDAFTELWQYATTEMYLHMSRDLSEAVLQNSSVWDAFERKSTVFVAHQVPLPHSNSPAAKQMRLAILLAILAREIDREIFQPTYIIPEDAGIRGTLAKLAACDNEKESFYRSILLSMDQDAQKASLQSRIQLIVRNVSSCMYDMLPEEQFSALRGSVEKIARKAVDVWRPMQRSVERYEPDFEPRKWGDDQWSLLEFPEENPAGSEASPAMIDDCLLIVFPRITVVEKGLRFPLTDVVQMRKSQPPCLAARRELADLPTSPVIGRAASNRTRRRSNAASDTVHQKDIPSVKKKPQGS